MNVHLTQVLPTHQLGTVGSHTLRLHLSAQSTLLSERIVTDEYHPPIVPGIMPYLTPNPNSPESQLKCEIIAAINNDREELFALLLSFIQASGPVDTHATTSEIITRYLSKRGIRTVAIGIQNDQPNITSLFNRSDGPCLVMSGLIPAPMAPHSKHYNAVPEETTPSLFEAKVVINTGLAATVAAYAYLHARQKHIHGTVVMTAIADNELGSRGSLEILLYHDERRGLFRGDCVLDSSSTGSETGPGGATTKAVHVHALEEAVSRYAQEFLGTEVAPFVANGPIYCDLWRQLDIPTYSYGLPSVASSVADGEDALLDNFVSLIKVHALAAWDYMRLEHFEE